MTGPLQIPSPCLANHCPSVLVNVIVVMIQNPNSVSLMIDNLQHVYTAWDQHSVSKLRHALRRELAQMVRGVPGNDDGNSASTVVDLSLIIEVAAVEDLVMHGELIQQRGKHELIPMGLLNHDQVTLQEKMRELADT
eukprot:6657878-Pyramimonas_sp.AAC.1